MYYAVRKGHTTGVFDNWPEAQAATSGFSGPEYKKFKTKEEAEAYLDNRDVWVDRLPRTIRLDIWLHLQMEAMIRI